MFSKRYFSKILLFGEYTILLGYPALTLPVKLFSGVLQTGAASQEELESAWEIKKLFTYLTVHEDFSFLELPQLKNDIEKGLFFQSNIPQGYGVGSSGAIVAAIFEKYHNEPLDFELVSEFFQNANSKQTEEIFRIKNKLALIESFFHGKSSGIDPLTIFLGKPLGLIGDILMPIDHEKLDFLNGHVYLFDSGLVSSTKGYVDYFLTKLEQPSFKSLISNELKVITESLYKSVASGLKKDFFESIRDLSDFQFKYFNRFIPERILDLWKKGLESQQYFMKLCGSGGGGFILVFTKERQPEILRLSLSSLHEITI